MQVGGFCPLENYAEDLPTKQNILCNRRSVRQILDEALTPPPSAAEEASRLLQAAANISAKIRDPSRFAVTTTAAGPLLPLNVHYVVPEQQPRRLVIVLERSSAMGLNNRWPLIHAELFRFISHLASDSEVAIVTYGATASLNLAPTRLTADNREGVYGRIPRKHLEEESACLECALRLGAQTLANAGGSDGTLVLITASAAKPAGWADLMASLPAAGPATTLHTVAFEQSIFYEARHLAGRHAAGQTFIVHEKHHDVLAGAVNISDIFTSILRSAGGVNLQKFHDEQKMSDDAHMVAGNFVVEESLRDNLWVQIASPEEDDIEMFELTNPTGQVFAFPRFEHGLVYFRLEGAQEPGIWSYRARLFQKDQYVRVGVQALAMPSHADSISLAAWTSVGPAGVNALVTPVKLFARLSSGTSPVLDAEVVATVHRPGKAEPVSVVLKDTGSGYPDLTRADGIYSAYFTQFTSEPGFYSVVVSVRNRDGEAKLPRLSSSSPTSNFTNSNSTSSYACCGSSLPFSFTVPVTHFHRHSLAGSFFVEEGSQFYLRQGSPTRNDVFPPGRITDFQLANYLDNSLYVTLKWTAPGNDYDHGTAFRYEVRCYTNREALREENFVDMGILVHTSLIPVPETVGVEQRSTVGIPWPNEVFYYAIVAYDEEGNRGQVSNVVAVYAEEKPSTPSPSLALDNRIKDDDHLGGSSSSYPVHHQSLPLRAANQDTLIYVVSGIVSAVLVLVLVVLVAALTRSRWTNRIKRSTSSQIYVKELPVGGGKTGLMEAAGSLPDIARENTLNSSRSLWRDTDSTVGEKSSIRKSPVPSISDNLSWKYCHRQMSAGGGSAVPGQQEAVAGTHRRVQHPANDNTSGHSTDSSMYSSASSDTTAAEFILGPSVAASTTAAAAASGVAPRISVMEDYTVYRDLSHLGSVSNDYFSFSQLPQELQGLSIVPYSPGYMDTVESSKSRRHISLV